MNESEETRPPQSGQRSKESAWERWELPFFEAGVESEMAGRTVSSVLEELLRVDGAEADTRHNTNNKAESTSEVSQADLSVHEECDNAFEQGYEDGKKKGYTEGYEQGLLEGRIEAQKEADHTLGEQKALLSSVIEALRTYNVRTDDVLIDRLCGLLRYMLGLIVPDALDASNDRLAFFIHQAVDQLPGTAESIVINMHPADARTVNTAMDAIPDHWVIKGDPELDRGSVWVESQYGYSELSVQAYIDRLWMDVRDQLFSNFSSAREDSSGVGSDDQYDAASHEDKRDISRGD